MRKTRFESDVKSEDSPLRRSSGRTAYMTVNGSGLPRDRAAKQGAQKRVQWLHPRDNGRGGSGKAPLICAENLKENLDLDPAHRHQARTLPSALSRQKTGRPWGGILSNSLRYCSAPGWTGDRIIVVLSSRIKKPISSAVWVRLNDDKPRVILISVFHPQHQDCGNQSATVTRDTESPTL